MVSQRVSGTAVTHSASRGSRVGGGGGEAAGERGLCAAECTFRGSCTLGAGQGWGWWGGGTLIYLLRVPPSSLRHRDDAPPPLLLGILVTESQKRMKEEEELKE